MYEKKEFQTIEEANIWADEKCKELSIKIGNKVTHMIFAITTKPLDVAIGFLKQPIRASRMQAYDMAAARQLTAAGQFLLSLCLIKEESDARILSEDPEYDSLYLGAITAAGDLVSSHVDHSKKK